MDKLGDLICICIYINIIGLCWLSNVGCHNGLQLLPHSRTYNVSTPRSSRDALPLLVTDYGAKGDGLTDDTQVLYSPTTFPQFMFYLV